MKNERLCGQCRYWVKHDQRGVVALDQPKQGECRALPPQVVVIGQSQIGAGFPPCHDKNWCGSWRSTEEAEDAEFRILPQIPIEKIRREQLLEATGLAAMRGMKFVVVDNTVPMTSQDWARASFRSEPAAREWMTTCGWPDAAFEILPIEKVLLRAKEEVESDAPTDS